MSSRGIWKLYSFIYSFIHPTNIPVQQALLGMFVMENQPGTCLRSNQAEREKDKESQTRGGSADGA